MNQRERWTLLAVSAALVALIWFVFGQTTHFGFINFDDPAYVYSNPEVNRGFTREGVVWAFTHTHAANWHPLTWLSHMLDCQLFGLKPGAHHLVNVILHTGTAILLFLVFNQMTRKLWRSAAVAALFAIHPLRVESVAWIAERKDLLSGVFFVLTIGAHLRYTRTKSTRSYAVVLLVFALGLLCKPMLVTVPLVLLLLDYWPLGRLNARSSYAALIIEKLPLLGLAMTSAVITIFAQQAALQPLAKMPLPLRLGNAVISIVSYIGQMFWPSGLALLYPFTPRDVSMARVLGALLVLIAISSAVFLLRSRRFPVVGWLWYLIMLLPVIGIVQVGAQAHADRYTYLPQLGLTMILVWGVAELTVNWRHAQASLACCGTIAVATLALGAQRQTLYWQSSEKLWRRSLALASGNVIAEQNLGEALHEKGKPAEAVSHLKNALVIDPNRASVHSALGVVLLELGRPADSLARLEQAVALDPNDGDIHFNLGNTLMALGRTREALDQYRLALERNPVDLQAMNNMAWLLATTPDVTIRNGAKAVELAKRADTLTRNGTPQTNATLAAAYAEAGQFDQAVIRARRALELAGETGDAGLGNSIRAQLRAYEAGSAFHPPPP